MLTSLLLAAAIGARVEQIPAAPREFRGVWVATVDNIDWPAKNVTDSVIQRKQLVAIMDKAQRLHLNAVILQVRPQADALYASSKEPWSEYLTGAQGKPPQPYYDPLEFAVWEAHLRGLELHAWFNPYRAWHPAAKGKPASNYIGNLHPEMVRSYGQYKWLDPGDKGVQQWSQDVIMDVVRRYDIDGVHIDDYFYPYPVREGKSTAPFPDERTWNAYVAAGGTLNRGDWRRKNVDDFIQSIYGKIKSQKPWVKFGISPFGIYRPGMPANIKAGLDQYGELYADPVKWLQNGWCDYLTPQLYWPITQQAQSYTVLLKWWLSQNKLHRFLWPGNMISSLGQKLPAAETLNQIAVTRKAGAGGNVFYSVVAFMKNYKGINEKLVSGPFSGIALVPPMPWLRSSPPSTPAISATRGKDGVLLSLKRTDAETWQWVFYVRRSSKWTLAQVVSADRTRLLIGPAGFAPSAEAVAVSGLDRYGNESTRVLVPLG